MKSGWINIYKPIGVSSAAAVAMVKRAVGKHVKVGHAGTLDVEAKGILPIAIGEATKLVQFLMDARKTYKFTVKFGATTDTGDAAGRVIKICEKIPSRKESVDVCKKFVGMVTQIPPKFSALKIKGVPAYKLAREGRAPEMKAREIEVFSLECIDYDEANSAASYVAEVSKGTYIRTLAEDISLSLQSLGFVIELARTKVGNFNESDSVNPESLKSKSFAEVELLMQQPEVVLADIPVIHVDVDIAQKVRYGQKVLIESPDLDLVWLENLGRVLAIGSVLNEHFLSARVFNLEL